MEGQYTTFDLLNNGDKPKCSFQRYIGQKVYFKRGYNPCFEICEGTILEIREDKTLVESSGRIWYVPHYDLYDHYPEDLFILERDTK